VVWSGYEGLGIAVEDGVATVAMRFQGEDEETRTAQHRELVHVWRDLDADPETRAVLITGAGDQVFYLSDRPPGSSPALRGDHAAMWGFTRMQETEVAGIVREMIHFPKPVVAATSRTPRWHSRPSDYSFERVGNPHTPWPPRRVRGAGHDA